MYFNEGGYDFLCVSYDMYFLSNNLFIIDLKQFKRIVEIFNYFEKQVKIKNTMKMHYHLFDKGNEKRKKNNRLIYLTKKLKEKCN